MKPINRLLTLLVEEEAMLRQRNFASLEAMSEEKVRLMDELGAGVDAVDLEKVKKQAAKNASLLSIVKEATQAVHKRIADIAARLDSVAYADGGERLSYTDEAHSSRRA